MLVPTIQPARIMLTRRRAAAHQIAPQFGWADDQLDMLSSVAARLSRRARGLQPLAVRAFQSSGDKLGEAEPVPLSKLKDSFLDGTSSSYLEELEERYRANPRSVDKTWASFFHSMGEEGPRP
jgi:hypothetical protein